MILDTEKLKTVSNYAHDNRISMRWVYDCLNNDKHPLEGVYIDGVRFVVVDDSIKMKPNSKQKTN